MPIATDMLYNLRSKYDREQVLEEYKNTNYGVVNPRTIDAVSFKSMSVFMSYMTDTRAAI